MQIDIEAARLRQREQPVEPACQNGGILFFSETERESSQPSPGFRDDVDQRGVHGGHACPPSASKTGATAGVPAGRISASFPPSTTKSTFFSPSASADAGARSSRRLAGTFTFDT